MGFLAAYEIYAHLLLINIARIFESDANNNIKSSSNENSTDLKDEYWQGFRDNLRKIKINFKNCLIVVGRHLEQLFLTNIFTINKWLPNIITAIVRVKQKIRCGRHYPRRSFKPANRWLRLGRRAVYA